MNELKEAKIKLSKAIKRLQSINIYSYDHYLKIVNHKIFNNLDVIKYLITASECKYNLAAVGIKDEHSLSYSPHTILTYLEQADKTIIEEFANTELKELIKPITKRATKIKKLTIELEKVSTVAQALQAKIQSLLDQPLTTKN